MKTSRKERLKDVAEKRRAIVEKATEESLALLNAEPHSHKIARENYRIVHEISLQLLTPDDGKITCPKAENVVSFLKRQVPNSPIRTARTVTNRYRSMTKIWTDAYDAILRLNIYNDGGWVDLTSSANAPHAGEFTELQIREEQIRRLQIAVNGLRAEILRMRSIGQGAIALQEPLPGKSNVIDLASFRKWVSQIGKKGSLLDVSDAGVKLTDKARINAIIMDRSTFDALTKLL